MAGLIPPDRLQGLVKDVFSKAPKTYTSFSSTLTTLKSIALAGSRAAVESGIQAGVTMSSGVSSGVVVGAGFASMTLFPLGAALAPWLGALAIAQASTQIFALYNLKEAATKTGAGGYPCTCGKCVESIGYIINKKENNVAIAAVSIFTVGLALAADRINSIRKSFQKNRPKEQMCRNLINGARGGCICAIGAIILLCGDWPEKVEKQQALILETTAIIWSDDKESGGLVRLKTKW